MFLGHYKVVELLWKKGVNLHIKNDSEEEPLAMAEKLSKILKNFKIKMFFDFMRLFKYFLKITRTLLIYSEKLLQERRKYKTWQKVTIKSFFPITFLFWF